MFHHFFPQFLILFNLKKKSLHLSFCPSVLLSSEPVEPRHIAICKVQGIDASETPNRKNRKNRNLQCIEKMKRWKLKKHRGFRRIAIIAMEMHEQYWKVNLFSMEMEKFCWFVPVEVCTKNIKKLPQFAVCKTVCTESRLEFKTRQSEESPPCTWLTWRAKNSEKSWQNFQGSLCFFG